MFIENSFFTSQLQTFVARYDEKYYTHGSVAIAGVCRQLSNAYLNFSNVKVLPSAQNLFVAQVAETSRPCKLLKLQYT
jgi:membrane carboxypeptidase/penicillin-binding protein